MIIDGIKINGIEIAEAKVNYDIVFTTRESDYIDLKYIETANNDDGTYDFSYVDTGIAPYKTKIEVKFAYTDDVGSRGAYVLGCWNADNNRFYVIQHYYETSANIFGIRNRLNNTTNISSKKPVYDANAHVIIYNDESNRAFIDGTLITQSGSYLSDLTKQSTRNIYLFGLNSYSSAEQKDVIGNNTPFTRIYWCKITNKQTGKLEGYFVPVIRKSDNAIGYYNKINNTFHPVQGDGKVVYELK